MQQHTNNAGHKQIRILETNFGPYHRKDDDLTVLSLQGINGADTYFLFHHCFDNIVLAEFLFVGDDDDDDGAQLLTRRPILASSISQY
mmetsp:Transcript_33499/g.37377  ORF Transcript_33499/g.37377 Transcript_33499/m.37377 type:complete len:88 (-) Transcript_33499:38-301(-)